jgi:hypothetical protein
VGGKGAFHPGRQWTGSGRVPVQFLARWRPRAMESYPLGQVRFSTIHQPSPSGVFGFLDVQEQSIGSGVFIIEQPAHVTVDESTDTWFSLAADRTAKAAIFPSWTATSNIGVGKCRKFTGHPE